MTPERYDVAVIGGGAGGVAAAVGAARAGAKVLLAERYGFLGGAATASQVLSYCGFFTSRTPPVQVTGGVGQAVLDGLAGLGIAVAPVQSPNSGNWILPLEPEAVKLVLDRLVLEAGVTLRLHTRLTAAVQDGGRIAAVTLVDHAGTADIRAAAFVDASGEANLAHLSGSGTWSAADEGGRPQSASYPVRIGGVDPDTVIDRAALRAAVAAFNGTGELPPIRADGGYIGRVPLTRDLWWLAINLETDGLTSASLTDAETAGRRLAWRNLAVLRQVPGFERAYVVSTGPQLGIRESRHGLAREPVSEADALAGSRRDDRVACGGWPIEVHGPAGAGFRHLGGAGWFDIPCGAIRSAGADNLWLASRTIGCDAMAYGSVRVMGTAFATGHAAGIAAADWAARRVADVPAVQDELRRQGAILEPDVDGGAGRHRQAGRR